MVHKFCFKQISICDSNFLVISFSCCWLQSTDTVHISLFFMLRVKVKCTNNFKYRSSSIKCQTFPNIHIIIILKLVTSGVILNGVTNLISQLLFKYSLIPMCIHPSFRFRSSYTFVSFIKSTSFIISILRR